MESAADCFDCYSGKAGSAGPGFAGFELLNLLCFAATLGCIFPAFTVSFIFS